MSGDTDKAKISDNQVLLWNLLLYYFSIHKCASNRSNYGSEVMLFPCYITNVCLRLNMADRTFASR